MPGEHAGEWSTELRRMADEAEAQASVEGSQMDRDRLYFLADLLKISSDIADITDGIEVKIETPLTQHFHDVAFREMVEQDFPSGLSELGPPEGHI